MSKRSESALARWRGIIWQHEASGLPVARFCQERGVPESSFFAWVAANDLLSVSRDP